MHACTWTIVAITLSLKSASYQTPLVKRINLAYNDDSFRPGEVECISDPVPPKVGIIHGLICIYYEIECTFHIVYYVICKFFISDCGSSHLAIQVGGTI